MADGSALPRWLDRVWTYIRRWKLGREERVIATAEHHTTDGAQGETIAAHILILAVDGNGRRYARIETTSKVHADTHRSLLKARMDWVHHGAVPPYARRVVRVGGANLILLHGGGPDVA